MKYDNRIKSVRPVGGYRVHVVFKDGYIGEVDLWPMFEHPRGPLTEPFRDLAFFEMVFLDGHTLTWPNGYDICSDVLRYYCEIGRVCSREELKAAFDPHPTEYSALILNDKPIK